MPVKTSSIMTDEDKAFRSFELSFKRVFKRQEARREKDQRRFNSAKDAGAFLTTEILRNRKELTKNGRQQLVMSYGASDTRKFTLAELNQMAKKIQVVEDRFGNGRGIKVGDLLRTSLPVDKQRAKQIRAAVPYKFAGNTIHFRVTASGETKGAPPHYAVRVRIEDWDKAVRRGEGRNYFPAAMEAVTGHISFDCSCGRHQFWYRYLATIGGFALMPEEHVFPKIRNPHLRGACCKHMLKTVLTMQHPAFQTRLAQEMERQAKRANFETARGKYVEAEDAKKIEEHSSSIKTRKAFREFMDAQAAFAAKMKTPAAQKALTDLQKRNAKKMEEILMKKSAAETVAKKEIARARQLEADMKRQWVGTLKTLKLTGAPLDKTIETLATNTGADKAMLLKIAKDEGLL